MNPEWARSLRDQCRKARVAFHFKQWGHWRPDYAKAPAGWRRMSLVDSRGRPVTLVRLGKHAAGRELDGRTWDEFPRIARAAQMVRARAPLDPKKYEPDEDGWPREIVGPWAADKYARVKAYVDISREVRRGFIGPRDAGATYIELFCGPGRVRFRDSAVPTHGSPLVAWRESARTNTRFTAVHVADADSRLVAAAAGRLKKEDSPVRPEHGKANETLARILPKLDRFALHVAFLDPYNLDSLSFDLIRKLAQLRRMDILIHVSLQDLNRNLLDYLDRDSSPLDSFAPDWRAHVSGDRSLEHVRGKLFEYWRKLVKGVDMSTAETAELVVGSNNQPLYWLAFVARHDRALEFWEKIRNVKADPQQKLF